MEYLIVQLSKKQSRKVSVLVNGEKNGYIGKILTLEEGSVEISADIPGAETKTIDLQGTTASKPAKVTILCGK